MYNAQCIISDCTAGSLAIKDVAKSPKASKPASASDSTKPAHEPEATVFRPKSSAELKVAVKECLAKSPSGAFKGGKRGPIGSWDVSLITDMSGLFSGRAKFNADISKWNVSLVINMSGMFRGAISFCCNIGGWIVSKVKSMRGMFAGAKAFNIDLSGWDVRNVTDMSEMFAEATSFNGDVSKWKVSRATTTREMFRGATKFNIDLSGWDISSVKDMRGMFHKAPSFKFGIKLKLHWPSCTCISSHPVNARAIGPKSRVYLFVCCYCARCRSCCALLRACRMRCLGVN